VCVFWFLWISLRSKEKGALFSFNLLLHPLCARE
jgi:hypothetical protein